MENVVNEPIVLYDGVCKFCQYFVKKIIQWDKNDRLKFAALQSDLGQELLKKMGLDNQLDSIVFYRPGYAYYIKSEAVIEILKYLNHYFSPFILLQFLPVKMSNFIYDVVAKNRYKWFGKTNQCMVPDEKIKKKFLS